MQTSALLGSKLLVVKKTMVYSHEQRGRESIFHDFVQASFMDGPLQETSSYKFLKSLSLIYRYLLNSVNTLSGFMNEPEQQVHSQWRGFGGQNLSNLEVKTMLNMSGLVRQLSNHNIHSGSNHNLAIKF